MPASKGDWYFVGQANRHEFDAKLKWLLTHQPDLPEARAVRDILAKPPLRPAPIAEHMLPDGGSVPDAKRVVADEANSHTSPARHRRRRHRLSCPKHLQHLLRFESKHMDDPGVQDSPEMIQLRRWRGLMSAADELQRDVPTLLGEPKPGKLLPRMQLPHVVGKGLSMFITGSFVDDPSQWDRRPQKEHPDFTKDALSVDPNAPEKNLEVPEHEKLLKIRPPKNHARLKDEIKTHHELTYTSGRTMMRGN